MLANEAEIKNLRQKNKRLEKENKDLRRQIKSLAAKLFVNLQAGYQISESPDKTTTMHMDLEGE